MPKSRLSVLHIDAHLSLALTEEEVRALVHAGRCQCGHLMCFHFLDAVLDCYCHIDDCDCKKPLPGKH